VGLILFALIAPHLPAPIFGLFPGLEGLIERSDHIAVVEITATTQERIERAGEPDHLQSGRNMMMLYTDFEVRVLRAILGDLEEGSETVVGLRSLPLAGVPWEFFRFNTGSCHLLFLQEDAPFSPYEPLGEPAVAFSQNCEGSHLSLAPGTDLFPELEASPRVIIEQIIRGSTGHWGSESDRRYALRMERAVLDGESADDLALEEAVQRIAERAEEGNTDFFAPLLGDPATAESVMQMIEQIRISEIAETYRDHISERSSSACHLDYHWLERGCHFQVDLVRGSAEWHVERIWLCR
jgi:hypothetical protein